MTPNSEKEMNSFIYEKKEVRRRNKEKMKQMRKITRGNSISLFNW
jgi:hypothetical protein